MSNQHNIIVVIGNDARPTYGPNRPWFAVHKFNSSEFTFNLTNQNISALKPDSDFIIFNGLTALMTPANLLLIEQLAERKHPHCIYLHDIDWCYQAYQRYHPDEARRLDDFDKQCTHFLAVSNNQKEFIQKAFNIPEEHIHVIGVSSLITPSNIDIEPEKDRSTLAFGTVATIQPRKGTDFFVDAAIKVCSTRPQASFHWFGLPFLDPSFQVELAHKIKAVNLCERIVFHGHIEDTNTCYQQLDVVLLPSRDDPFSLCVLEAMSFGRLCIGFKSGGYPEQVADTGIVIPEMSASALAQTCLQVIDNPTLLNKGTAAQTRYNELHHPQVFIQRLTNAIESIFSQEATR